MNLADVFLPCALAQGFAGLLYLDCFVRFSRCFLGCHAFVSFAVPTLPGMCGVPVLSDLHCVKQRQVIFSCFVVSCKSIKMFEISLETQQCIVDALNEKYPCEPKLVLCHSACKLFVKYKDAVLEHRMSWMKFLLTELVK